jgi:hypothetical protein
MGRKINLSIWSFEGDTSLSEMAKIIAELKEDIKEIDNLLYEQEEILEALNNRLTIYIKNIFNIDDYDHTKDAIFINEKYLASIYPIEFLTDDKFEPKKLPNSDRSYQITRNQAQRIADYVNEYAVLSIEYENQLSEYDELFDYHEEIWDGIHRSIRERNLLHVVRQESNDEIEIFDEKKHILLVLKDESGSWGFRYIRKKDEKKFHKFIEQNKKEEV